MRQLIHIVIGVFMIGCIVVDVGCTNTYQGGTNVQKLESYKIEKNKTTAQDLIAQFGQPASVMTNSDGSQTMTWSGYDAQSHDLGLLEGITMPLGISHEDVNSNNASLVVTVRNGIIVDYQVMTSNQNTHL